MNNLLRCGRRNCKEPFDSDLELLKRSLHRLPVSCRSCPHSICYRCFRLHCDEWKLQVEDGNRSFLSTSIRCPKCNSVDGFDALKPNINPFACRLIEQYRNTESARAEATPPIPTATRSQPTPVTPSERPPAARRPRHDDDDSVESSSPSEDPNLHRKPAASRNKDNKNRREQKQSDRRKSQDSSASSLNRQFNQEHDNRKPAAKRTPIEHDTREAKRAKKSTFKNSTILDLTEDDDDEESTTEATRKPDSREDFKEEDEEYSSAAAAVSQSQVPVAECGMDGHDESDFCTVCQENGELIVCDGGHNLQGCNRSFHIECVNRQEIPQGDWICRDCARQVNLDVGIEGHEFPIQGVSEEYKSSDDDYQEQERNSEAEEELLVKPQDGTRGRKHTKEKRKEKNEKQQGTPKTREKTAKIFLQAVPRAEREKLEDKEDWFDEFKIFLEEVLKDSEKNVKNVLPQVKLFMSGNGITYQHWDESARFMPGIKVNLACDFHKMLQDAFAMEAKYGKDKGNGWLMRHPIRKMGAFQAYLLDKDLFRRTYKVIIKNPSNDHEMDG